MYVEVFYFRRLRPMLRSLKSDEEVRDIKDTDDMLVVEKPNVK